MLDPDRLDPATLADEIEALRTFEPVPPAIDLDGGERTCERLSALAGRVEAA
jgi:predicted glycosyltransferase